LRPSQQTARETNIKEVSELETWTVNSNGKHDQTAIAEYDEPNPPPNTVESLRQVVPPVPTIDPTIMVEQETPQGEVNQSPLSIVRPDPPDSPSLLASKLSDDLAIAAT